MNAAHPIGTRLIDRQFGTPATISGVGLGTYIVRYDGVRASLKMPRAAVDLFFAPAVTQGCGSVP